MYHWSNVDKGINWWIKKQVLVIMVKGNFFLFSDIYLEFFLIQKLKNDRYAFQIYIFYFFDKIFEIVSIHPK